MQLSSSAADFTAGRIDEKLVTVPHVGHIEGLALLLYGNADDVRHTWKLLKASVEDVATHAMCAPSVPPVVKQALIAHACSCSCSHGGYCTHACSRSHTCCCIHKCSRSTFLFFGLWPRCLNGKETRGPDDLAYLLAASTCPACMASACRHWFAPSHLLTPGKLSQLTPYPADPESIWPVATITVQTSSCWQVGTDAGVWVTLLGTKTNTPKLQLSSSCVAPETLTDRITSAVAAAAATSPLKSDNKGNGKGARLALFQRGARDVFRVAIPDIGEILEVEVGHDNASTEPPWSVDAITISCDKSALNNAPYCAMFVESLGASMAPLRGLAPRV